jgi:hypothetical protein
MLPSRGRPTGSVGVAFTTTTCASLSNLLYPDIPLSKPPLRYLPIYPTSLYFFDLKSPQQRPLARIMV